MKILIEVDKWLSKYFNIMAFLRTLVCIIVVWSLFSSCATVECVYSDTYWVRHQIHFSENMDMADCYWCAEYNKLIP